MSATTHTLVLTPWMSPHRIVTWFDAICLWYTGKAEVLEEYDETVSSPSTSIKIPAVVRLVKNIPHKKKDVKFSRFNVMCRDNFTCQYCGKKFPMKKLNYDHVLPKSHGGKTTWENVCASCYDCNHKKDDRTPEQAHMHLLKKPVKPSSLAMTTLSFLNYEGHTTPEIWKPYIQTST